MEEAVTDEWEGHPWGPLVDEAYAALPEGGLITCVKAKFGRLFIYANNVPSEYYRLLCHLRERSGKICQKCGNPGEIRDMEWVQTMCDSCFMARPAWQRQPVFGTTDMVREVRVKP